MKTIEKYLEEIPSMKWLEENGTFMKRKLAKENRKREEKKYEKTQTIWREAEVISISKAD